jgi:hypothetical protein
MINITTFTAILGPIKDQLRPVIAPRDKNRRCTRYICFSDAIGIEEGADLGWSIRRPVWRHDDPRRMARWHKVNSDLAIPDADYTLWCDGSEQLKVNPWNLVDQYLAGADLATFRHPDRACVYAELEMCMRRRKDNEAAMKQQIERYRIAGWPPNKGLFETNVVLRRHSPAVLEFNRAWWTEISGGSLRDQLSVNFSADQTGLKVAILPGNRTRSPIKVHFPHR